MSYEDIKDQMNDLSSPRTPQGHVHKEAFCLMWYRCDECYHMERFWNSRDGATPFCTQCPSCGNQSLQHVYYSGSYQYAPDHKPPVGQKVWIDMTWERAQQVVRRRIDMFKAHGLDVESIETNFGLHVDRTFGNGTYSDMAVSGYGWELL